jgi:hypothetical protein
MHDAVTSAPQRSQPKGIFFLTSFSSPRATALQPPCEANSRTQDWHDTLQAEDAFFLKKLVFAVQSSSAEQ